MDKITRPNLLRHIYQALLNNGNTYAGFNLKQVSPIIERLADRDKIFDPMSGYGNTMKLCAKYGCSSFSIEANPPSFLWSTLFLPQNEECIKATIQTIRSVRHKWPNLNQYFIFSEEWFHEEALELLLKLFNLFYKASLNHCSNKNASEISMAILLPFSGRFSNSVPGNIVTHVKPGGICAYKNWRDDFNNYLNVLEAKIIQNANAAKNKKHTLLLGDCITIAVQKERFSAMLSSPPYPNSRDYSAMFAPENYLLTYFEKQGIIKGLAPKTKLIGSVLVSDLMDPLEICMESIESQSAKTFLNNIINFNGSKRALYDNKIYYLPYFANYFKSIENAYKHISQFLAKDFEGFIVVINNTARGYIVPVAECVTEIWKSLGFKVVLEESLSGEKSHFGAINPRAKGLRAKHMESVLRISRR
jgi:hypothetical protein